VRDLVAAHVLVEGQREEVGLREGVERRLDLRISRTLSPSKTGSSVSLLR
jgi:hypothetical protein